MKRRRVEGRDGGETFTLCRSHLFQMKASGGYPSGAQVRARNTQWAVWGTSSQSNMKAATAKPSLCELVVTSGCRAPTALSDYQELIWMDRKIPGNPCGLGWGLSSVSKHVPSTMGSTSSQLLGAFPGTRTTCTEETSAAVQYNFHTDPTAGTQVSGKLINQGKGLASKNRKQRRRTTTGLLSYDHPAQEGRRALVGGRRSALINWWRLVSVWISHLIPFAPMQDPPLRYLYC